MFIKAKVSLSKLYSVTSETLELPRLAAIIRKVKPTLYGRPAIDVITNGVVPNEIDSCSISGT